MIWRDFLRKRIKKKAKWDERGALEGLPLYMIILVVITGIGIVIIVGWLTTFQKPMLDRLEIVEPTNKEITTMTDGSFSYMIVVKAYSDKGKALEGVEITFSGPGIDTKKITEANGKAIISGNGNLGENINTGSITITASYVGRITGPYTIVLNKP